ncbi:MAG: MsnO8 family LLM class oxidoreductase, partial [Microbacterium sp.]|nr:MsnO8 family LLM class oxidoreductase [Microbacterium sp.]
GQSSAQAVAASIALVRAAEEAGATRYWFAEHHNMPAVASTSPPVLIAAAAAATSRIRVGSGGVMLPNHAPFIVAEQFAALEAIAPGRIDLGLGRAPGSDGIVTQVLRSNGIVGDVERFPDHVTDIVSLMRPGGATLRLTSGTPYAITATPAATGSPEVWLLGSSDYSAHVAAQLGLPYVFANHFAGEGLERALELYRREFEPSEALAEPRTFVTVNAVVAERAEEAAELALPQARSFARIRTGRPLRAVETVEEALAAPLDPVLDELVAGVLAKWIVGDPASAAAAVRSLAERHGVDEVMISPAAGARESDPLDRVPAREDTVRLLAQSLSAAAS